MYITLICANCIHNNVDDINNKFIFCNYQKSLMTMDINKLYQNMKNIYIYGSHFECFVCTKHLHTYSNIYNMDDGYNIYIRPVISSNINCEYEGIQRLFFDVIKINPSLKKHTFILGECYHVYHLTTIKKFNIEMTSDTLEHISQILVQHGKIDEFISMYYCGLRFTSFDFPTFSRILYDIFNNNDILVKLNLLKTLGITLKNYNHAIEPTNSKGNIHVLNWFYENGYNIDCTSEIITNVSRYGYVDVLNWYFTKDLGFCYDSNAIDEASINGHIHILDWWVNSGLELKYTVRAMDSHDIDVLNWWLNSGLKLQYRQHILSEQSTYYTYCNMNPKPFNVVKWWLTSGLPIENYTSHTFFKNIQSYTISDLELLFNTALQLKMNNKI